MFDLILQRRLLHDEESKEARDLGRQLEEINKQLSTFHERHDGLPPELQEEVAHRKMRRLEQTVERLHRGDRHDLAERVNELRHDIAATLGRTREPREDGRLDDGPGPDQEWKRRMHHVRHFVWSLRSRLD